MINFVLILVVVDNGLVHRNSRCLATLCVGLNPYCSGQWSRTSFSSSFHFNSIMS